LRLLQRPNRRNGDVEASGDRSQGLTGRETLERFGTLVRGQFRPATEFDAVRQDALATFPRTFADEFTLEFSDRCKNRHEQSARRSRGVREGIAE
jgi:hypothetical protein